MHAHTHILIAFTVSESALLLPYRQISCPTDIGARCSVQN